MSSEPQPPGTALPAGPLAETAAGRDLRGCYRQDFERVRRDFDATGSGPAAIGSRTRIVDRLTLTLWDCYFGQGMPRGVAMLAVGGYGRMELFPHSDVDLLFLTAGEGSPGQLKEAVSGACQQ